jgi:hypothetical protein
VPKSTPTMILSDVTWTLFSVSPLPLTTGVGAEKLTLGPAIGKRCFYGSIEERESSVDVVSQSVSQSQIKHVQRAAEEHKTDESSKSQELRSARKTATEWM